MGRKDLRVKDFMTTDLFTVGPGDIVTERDFMSITTRMLEGTSIAQSNSPGDGA